MAVDIVLLASQYRVELLIVLASLVVLRFFLRSRKSAAVATPTEPAQKATSASSSGFLDSTEWREVTLTYKETVNHNTQLFRFALPSTADVLNLPVGKHVKLGIPDLENEGKMIQRAYTPVSTAEQKGYFDLIIKIYPKGVMGQHVNNMKIGEKIKVRGPNGQMKYAPNMKKHIGMIAGGSGITPMLQLARFIASTPSDKTQVSLIFANIAEQDILCRNELDAMAERHPDKFKRFYVLNETPADWTMGVGYVSQEHIKANLPAPGPDTLICLCGPPPMLAGMQKHLEALGYTKEMIFQY